MKLHLNLSVTPPPNKRPFLLAAFILGAVGIALLLLLSHAAYSTWRSSGRLRADTSHWQREITENSAKQQELAAYFASPAAKQVLSRSEFLNSLIGQRSFPWTKIFVDLEKTLPPGVRIVSIAPTLGNGGANVELIFGASTDEGKIKFLRALEQSSAFSHVQEQEEKPVTGRDLNAGASSTDRIEVKLTAWYSTT